MRTSDRSLLQRRKSLSNTIQAVFDGVAVTLLVYGFTIFINGVFSAPYLLMTILLLVIMAIVYNRFSIYRSYNGLTKKSITIAKAWSLTFFILLGIGFLSKQTDFFSRTVITSVFVFGFVIQVAGHYFIRHAQLKFLKPKNQMAKALVIGTGQLADHIYERVNKNPWVPEQIVGAVLVNDEHSTKINEDAWPPPIPVLGNLPDLVDLIHSNQIQTVYIAVPLSASNIVKEVYFDLLDANVNIHWVPNIFSLDLINHSFKELAGLPVLTLSESPLIGSNLLLKTIEDKILASISLVLLSPIMLITALAIKLESRGPVMFKQLRTGWDGKEFWIWKFRSMRIDQENPEKVIQVSQNDPRVTRIGRFLRRTSIDELPQLFNVLTGRMSLVGPRPHAIAHNEDYAKRITAYLARHRIKPGMTGLAQVKGLRGETKELSKMAKRVEYDLEYINNWSLWLDMTILLRTIFVVFKSNAY